jgi:hypothetical protein
MNIDNAKSYATENSLMRALARYGFDKDRFLIVRNRAGRFTALFPMSNFRDGGYVGIYGDRGFMTVG